MPTNSTPVKKNLRQILEEVHEIDTQILEKLNLKYPKDMEAEEKYLWDELFTLLSTAFSNRLVKTEDIPAFEKNFYKKSVSDKIDYLKKLKDKLDQEIYQIEQIVEYSKNQEIETKIEQEKSKIPEQYKPLFEYLAYSVVTGTPIPEAELKEIELALSPEGQEAIIQQNLQKTIDQYRRNPLNAGRMAQGANFNQAYTKEQVAQILDQAQGLPTQQQQRIQPRAQNSAPNQQRAKAKPNIEFVQTNPQARSQFKQTNTLPKNVARKSSLPTMPPTPPIPKAKTSSIDQTKSLLDQTSGVNKHNKGLDELL